MVLAAEITDIPQMLRLYDFHTILQYLAYEIYLAFVLDESISENSAAQYRQEKLS